MAFRDDGSTPPVIDIKGKGDADPSSNRTLSAPTTTGVMVADLVLIADVMHVDDSGTRSEVPHIDVV